MNTIIKTSLARDDRRVFTLSGNEVFSHDALGLCFEFPSPHKLLKINCGEVIGFQSTDLKVFCKIYYLIIVDITRTIVCFTLSSLVYFMNFYCYIFNFYCFDVVHVNTAVLLIWYPITVCT